jgi:hypothetical protein
LTVAAIIKAKADHLLSVKYNYLQQKESIQAMAQMMHCVAEWILF